MAESPEARPPKSGQFPTSVLFFGRVQVGCFKSSMMKASAAAIHNRDDALHFPIHHQFVVSAGFGESELGCGAISDPSRSTKAWFNFARN